MEEKRINDDDMVKRVARHGARLRPRSLYSIRMGYKRPSWIVGESLHRATGRKVTIESIMSFRDLYLAWKHKQEK